MLTGRDTEHSRVIYSGRVSVRSTRRVVTKPSFHIQRTTHGVFDSRGILFRVHALPAVCLPDIDFSRRESRIVNALCKGDITIGDTHTEVRKESFLSLVFIAYSGAQDSTSCGRVASHDSTIIAAPVKAKPARARSATQTTGEISDRNAGNGGHDAKGPNVPYPCYQFGHSDTTTTQYITQRPAGTQQTQPERTHAFGCASHRQYQTVDTAGNGKETQLPEAARQLAVWWGSRHGTESIGEFDERKP